MVKSGAYNGAIAELPESCRPGEQLIFTVIAEGNPAVTARVDVKTNGQIHHVAGGEDSGWLSLTGIKFTVQSGPQSLKLGATFKGYSESRATTQWMDPQYTRSGTLCLLAGFAKALNENTFRLWGKWNKGVVLFATLPTECRPATQLVYNQNPRRGSSRVDINPNGDVSISNDYGGEKSVVSLSGIVTAPVRFARLPAHVPRARFLPAPTYICMYRAAAN